jgi:hypothetical protein
MKQEKQMKLHGLLVPYEKISLLLMNGDMWAYQLSDMTATYAATQLLFRSSTPLEYSINSWHHEARRRE